MNEEKGTKKKKRGIAIIISIVAAILVVIIFASFFFVIILQGIIEAIAQVIGSIIDLLKDPWYHICEFARGTANFISKWLNLSKYIPPDPENITIVLPDDYVTQMKNSMESNGIDLDAAALKDIMLKKMVLTSFKSSATNTTEVAMIVTDEEYRDLKDEDSDSTFYRMKMEDENGVEQKYIATKGIVNVQVNTDDGLQDMYCYTQSKLQEIINQYNKAIEDDKDDYAEEVREVLDNSYTVESIGVIKINSQQTSKEITTNEMIYSTSSDVLDKYKKAGILAYSNYNNVQRTTDVIVEYSESISEYIMPLEFVTALLEITASPDFALEVCNLIHDSEIELAIYPEKEEEVTVKEKNYKVDLSIEAFENSNDEGRYEATQNINNSEVMEVERTTAKRNTYGSVVTSVDTWWCKVKNSVKKVEEEFFIGIDKDGNEIEEELQMDNLWTEAENEVIDTDIEEKWSNFKNTSINNSFSSLFSGNLFNYLDYNYKDNYIEITKSSGVNLEDKFREKILQVEYINRDTNTDIVKSITEEKKDIKERQYMKVKRVGYEKNATQVDDNTDKFLELLRDSSGNDVEYMDLYKDPDVKVGKLLVNGAEMLFEILESFDNSKEMADIMRYILYRYSNENYGITDFNELVNIFGTMHSMGGLSSATLLKSYIRSWEGAPKKNADGTKYIVYDDGFGNATVGWGVDINNSGYKEYFIQAGYNVSIGSEIDIDFVDKIEEEIMTNYEEEVRAKVSGLDLKEYQIHALVSRAYNMGVAGATGKKYTDNDFVTSYGLYWDDSDDLFGQDEADYNCELYTKYMCKVVTSKGKYAKGLEKRRKSEWRLFQTGYYDTIGKSYSGSGGDLLAAADEVHQEQITWTYSTGGDLFWNNIEKSVNNPNRVTCCATFVSTAIYRAGYFSEEQMNSFNYNYCPTLYDFLIGAGWQKISSYDELQPGDVVFTNNNKNNDRNLDHVQLYAGDGTWYNAGTTTAIQRSSPYSQGSWPKQNFYVAVRPN